MARDQEGAVAIDLAHPLGPTRYKITQTSPPNRPVARVLQLYSYTLHSAYGLTLSSRTKTMPYFQVGWWRTAGGSAGGFFSQLKWLLVTGSSTVLTAVKLNKEDFSGVQSVVYMGLYM